MIASLFELSKAANEVSKNAIDFFNLTQAQQHVGEAASSSSSTESKKSLASGSESNLKESISESIIAEDGVLPDEKKQKKKKMPKDPNAPKKPLTSYLLFCNHLRASVAEQNSEFSQIDIAKEVARQWKELSEEDKNYWKGLYEKDKVRYDGEMVKYNASKDDSTTAVSETPKAEKRNIEEIVDVEDADSEAPADITITETPKKKKNKKNKKTKKEN